MMTQNKKAGVLRGLKESIKRATRATPQARYPLSKTQLDLKAGELVEVRSREEILATLDERGALENLPFMPEMLQYCGRRLQVYKRADKTCDNIESWSIRRIENTVHLQDVRCDGASHDSCQAGCLIFWKEAWLKRTSADVVDTEVLQPKNGHAPPRTASRLVTVESIVNATRVKNDADEILYSCQATEVLRFTSYMASWDPRQYFRDVRSGNLDSGLAGDSRAERALELFLALLKVAHALAIPAFNRMQSKLDGHPYPVVVGAVNKTPLEVLDLEPGEFVQVRSKEEIFATLDKNHRNRGLLFDAEMLPFCGGIYRVLRRVHHIIDEKTGRMMSMKYPCIVLEGVFCQSDYHRLCPRAIYSYWRENWLRRVGSIEISAPLENRESHSCAGGANGSDSSRGAACAAPAVLTGQEANR